MFKLPTKAQDDNYYYYFDDKTKQTKADKSRIDVPGEPLYETMNQYNLNGNYKMLAWSDQIPNDTMYTTSGAHSKGLFILDMENEDAVYIMHSTPRYPAIYNDPEKGSQIDIHINPRNRIYGQSFFCMSLKVD